MDARAELFPQGYLKDKTGRQKYNQVPEHTVGPVQRKLLELCRRCKRNCGWKLWRGFRGHPRHGDNCIYFQPYLARRGAHCG